MNMFGRALCVNTCIRSLCLNTYVIVEIKLILEKMNMCYRIVVESKLILDKSIRKTHVNINAN